MEQKEKNPTVGELTADRLAETAEGLLPEFSKDQINTTSIIIKKLCAKLYDTTRGFGSNPKVDDNITKTVTQLEKVSDSLSKAISK
jgi:hypothetical protein